MPRYFFHVRADDDLIEDEDGVELSCREVLENGRLQEIVDKLAREERADWWREDFDLEIVDEAGKAVRIVPFQL
jgi:hypothetical protein